MRRVVQSAVCICAALAFGLGVSAAEPQRRSPPYPIVRTPAHYAMLLPDAAPSDGVETRYRSLCVRTCDGYYWPIRESNLKSGLAEDQAICKASCAMEADLYVLPKGSEDIGSMQSLDGKLYSDLETAYRYRTALTPGCACKAAPWSQLEHQRHETYGMPR